MKKNVLLYAAALVFSFFLLSSCKKNIGTNPEIQAYERNITAWIDAKVDSNASGLAYAADMKKSLDYEHMQVEPSASNEKIVIIPFKEAFLQSRKADPGQLGNLVVLVNSADNIRKINIVLFKPDADKKISALPENTFYDIFNTAKVKANGTFNFLDINGKLQYQLGYRDGKMRSSGTVQARTLDEYRMAQQGVQVKANSTKENIRIGKNDITCIYFFMIIDWYNSAGVYQGSTWYLIGSSCSDVPQDVQPDTPPGGGGFQGPDGNYWNGGAQYEYAVSTEWLWTAHSLPYGAITSTETVTGKKVSGEVDGGHFTDVMHGLSQSTDPSESWSQTTWHYTISANLLYLYLNGDITNTSGTTSISESRTFSFSGLFP